MDKILVLSDLHIREPGKTIAGLDPMERLHAALQDALAQHGDAAAMILLGDLTHSGKTREYARLHEVLARVTLPVLPMLGNHDNRASFRKVFGPEPAGPEDSVQSLRDLERHRIITLDTLDGPPFSKTRHSGALSAAQLGWLREALEGAGERQPLVFMHHPPMKIGLPGMDEIRLQDGKDVLALLAAHPGAHLFSGHAHRTVSGMSRGVAYTLFKSTCHQAPLDLVSEDCTLTTDAPGGYGLLLLQKHGLAVHQVDVGQPGKVWSGAEALP